MWTFILKRLLLMVPLLVGITLVSFVVIHTVPGTPVEIQTTMNPKASLEAQKRLRELYGLDKPLHVQYWDWLKRMASLDFGLSFSPDRRHWNFAEAWAGHRSTPRFLITGTSMTPTARKCDSSTLPSAI